MPIYKSEAWVLLTPEFGCDARYNSCFLTNSCEPVKRVLRTDALILQFFACLVGWWSENIEQYRKTEIECHSKGATQSIHYSFVWFSNQTTSKIPNHVTPWLKRVARVLWKKLVVSIYIHIISHIIFYTIIIMRNPTSPTSFFFYETERFFTNSVEAKEQEGNQETFSPSICARSHVSIKRVSQPCVHCCTCGHFLYDHKLSRCG